jgi:hypothetical protein
MFLAYVLSFPEHLAKNNFETHMTLAARFY